MRWRLAKKLLTTNRKRLLGDYEKKIGIRFSACTRIRLRQCNKYAILVNKSFYDVIDFYKYHYPSKGLPRMSPNSIWRLDSVHNVQNFKHPYQMINKGPYKYKWE